MTTNTINDGLSEYRNAIPATIILKFSLGTYVRIPSHPQKGLFLQLYVLKFSVIVSRGLV